MSALGYPELKKEVFRKLYAYVCLFVRSLL